MSYARIKMFWPKGAVEATLEGTPTARALVAALPVKAKAQTWGEEVYFEVPVKAKAQTWGEEVYFDIPVTAALERDAKQVVPLGSVCFWVEGSALALPWGRTPVSEGDESRLVTRCNVLGRIDGDPRRLASVRSGDGISVSLK